MPSDVAITNTPISAARGWRGSAFSYSRVTLLVGKSQVVILSSRSKARSAEP